MDNKKNPTATIVSPSHQTAWSQAYAAGNLFAVVSLTQPEKSNTEIDTLGIIGKEILNTLEAEYFTLETKNLESIQNAIHVAIKNALEKDDVVLSACFASLVENTLYIFALNGAKASMRREGKLGLLLSGKEPILEAASGFLQTNDLIIIQTKTFEEIVSKDKLTQAIEHIHPAHIAENLSPLLQEYEKGGAAAVILLYNQDQKDIQQEEETPKQQEIVIHTKELNNNYLYKIPQIGKIIQTLLGLAMSKLPHIELSRKKKLFLGIGIILVFLLFFGIFYTARQKEAAKQQALFQNIYTAAQKKLEEGQGLAGLNKNLSRDDFTQAKKLILDNKDKFNNNKALKEKLDTLLKNVEDGLLTVSGVNRVDAKPVDGKLSIILSIALANSPMHITQDDKTIYTIDDKEVASFDKKTKNKKTLISNKEFWSSIDGLSIYNGNIYVLDKNEGQIFKFVGSNSSNYFSLKQDLSKAESIAIDGSIWILYSDGVIQKWTRGKQDSFTVSGLDEVFKNPTRIFTDTESGNLYILDNGNGRIVVIKKNGAYETQYQTEVVKTATEFDVVEKDKKIFVLKDNKVWELDLSSN